MADTKNELRLSGTDAEREKRMMAARAAQALRGFSEEMRPKIMEAAKGTVETLRQVFPGVSPELLADFADAFAGSFAAILMTPAYALSDTLDHTAAAYTVAAAMLSGGFEMPEGGEPVEDAPDIEKLKADFAEAVKHGEITVLSDDPQTGMYL